MRCEGSLQEPEELSRRRPGGFRQRAVLVGSTLALAEGKGRYESLGQIALHRPERSMVLLLDHYRGRRKRSHV